MGSVEKNIIKDMKLVPESLTEAQDFQKGQDPKRAMGIGIEPLIDQLSDAYSESPDNIKNLFSFDDFREGDAPNVVHFKGTIDHPMSGYGGVFNEAHMNITLTQDPATKVISVKGTKQMLVGDYDDREGDLDYDDGDGDWYCEWCGKQKEEYELEQQEDGDWACEDCLEGNEPEEDEATEKWGEVEQLDFTIDDGAAGVMETFEEIPQ